MINDGLMTDDRLLSEKTGELSGIVENNLEAVLNMLINNNFESFANNDEDFYSGRTKKLNNEIHNAIINILSNKNDRSLYIQALRINSFSIEMQNIFTLILLIKFNIKELSKYPLLKRQASIPNIALLISSIVKNSIDAFFENDVNSAGKVLKEIKNIKSLSQKILKELAQSPIEDDVFANKSRIVYYSVVISYLEEIAIIAGGIVTNLVILSIYND